MRTAYFDCFAGASGDMVLGALIDLGLDPAHVRAELAKLGLPGWRLEVRPVNKLGVTAVKVDVLLQTGDGGEVPADAAFAEGPPGGGAPAHDHHGPSHTHEHHGPLHTHDHHAPGVHAHPPAGAPGAGEGGDAPDSSSHHPARPLRAILGLLERSALHTLDRERAVRIFTRLGEAEGKVHGIPPAEVHFHEVGGADAIVDVVGACVGLRLLGIERVVVSPLHVGSGFVRMAHGVYPVPGPATANLLAGAPVYATGIKGELVTPTGAAILTTLADEYGPLPAMVVRATGYGAGTRDREIPNVLRVMVGDAATPAPAGYRTEAAVMLEANIDDMNPELYTYVVERLFAAGAMDVFLTPAQMKKGRPANVLHVLVAPAAVEEALAIVFAETSTIGVRTYGVVKQMLAREIITVPTPYGPVRVKVAQSGGRVLNVAPEYEDCRTAARAHAVPLKAVYQAAQQAAAAQT